jgi:hypothetical protein
MIRKAFARYRKMSMEQKIDIMVASGALTPKQAEVGKRNWAARQAAAAAEAAMQAEQPA